jgi:hypothetical protein
MNTDDSWQGFCREFIGSLVRVGGLKEMFAVTNCGAVGFYEHGGFSIESLGEKSLALNDFLVDGHREILRSWASIHRYISPPYRKA